MTSRLIVLSFYAALATVAIALVLLPHQRTARLAPLSTLLQAILVHRSVRVVIVLFWWWLGWHFLVEP